MSSARSLAATTGPRAVVLIRLLLGIVFLSEGVQLPVLVGHPIWGFSLPNAPMHGVWGALHEARADLSMIFCLLFLLAVGGGQASADAKLWPVQPEGR